MSPGINSWRGELHELDGILYDIIDEETGLPYTYEMNEMTV